MSQEFTKANWWAFVERVIPGADRVTFIDESFRCNDGSRIEIDPVGFDDRMAIREQLVAEVLGYAEPC